jgi:hypothetical protein
MAEVDWSNAAWDTIPAYRLRKDTVDSFLQGLFGYYNFYTQVLPRCPLSQPSRETCLLTHLDSYPRTIGNSGFRTN